MIYDLAIIGAGSAGYVAAERAGLAGMSVLQFEKRNLGGVCLNEGCIPTKTLLYSAKLYENALNGKKYGIETQAVTANFTSMMTRKNKVIKKLVGGVAAKMKHAKVEQVDGEATIKQKAQNHFVLSANGQEYLAKNILIATGAEAFLPPISGLNRDIVLTSREILQLDSLPESLNIIGGGVIGMEFASFFSTLGTTVNVFEMMPEILPGTDSELAQMLRADLSKKGVNFFINAQVTAIENNTVIYQQDSTTGRVEAEKLLVSVGRKPNVSGLGLEALGVEMSNSGIKIDDHCRTNVPGIYAAGDLTGFSQLAHTASREGTVAVNHMLGKPDRMRYNAVPAVVYTNPEIACVGLTEEEAKAKGIPAKTLKLPMAYAGRFIVENEGKNGLAKIVVGEKYGEVLGVHLYGNPSSEIIHSACMAIEMQLRVQDLQEMIFPHPTVSEIIHELVFED